MGILLNGGYKEGKYSREVEGPEESHSGNRFGHLTRGWFFCGVETWVSIEHSQLYAC